MQCMGYGLSFISCSNKYQVNVDARMAQRSLSIAINVAFVDQVHRSLIDHLDCGRGDRLCVEVDLLESRVVAEGRLQSLGL